MAAALPFLALAATVASTALTFKGQMDQQAAMGAQASFMQQQAQQQADRARQQAAWQADDALSRGKVAEDAQRRKTQQAIGTQTAQLAGQGTDISGSATDILGDTAAAGELDAATIKNNAQREAYGYKVQGENAATHAGTEAQLMALKANSGSSLGAGASLLSGASTLGERWWRFQRDGGLGGGPAGRGELY